MPRLHPWPAALIAGFVLFVSFYIGLIVFVSRGFEGPDDDHYYKHGLEYDRQIRQQSRQHDLGWQVTSNLPQSVRGQFPLQVRLADAKGQSLQRAQVQVDVMRPATRKDDRTLRLSRQADGLYAAVLDPGPGVWDVKLTVRSGNDTFVETTRTRVAR